jgi:hypothetical protein
MKIPTLSSIKTIEQQYQTGENPVLVLCSDKNAYICKYMRSSGSAYKLACELIGSVMALTWNINTPSPAFVKIKQQHWSQLLAQRYSSTLAYGTKRKENIVDITPTTFSVVPTTKRLVKELLEIALFDCWIANEDRNINNANLMYDIEHSQFVSIDYGCILNTATFEYPLSQLTSTDTILYSDLFHHIIKGTDANDVLKMAESLRRNYQYEIQQCQAQIDFIVSILPPEWAVPSPVLKEKLQQLMDVQWVDAVWNNFVSLLNENL